MHEVPRLPGLRPGSAADTDGLGTAPSIVSAEKSQYLVRLRRQRLVERVHRLGARPLFELIDEIARHYGLADDIDQRLERYAALDPDILSAVRADRFPPPPLRAVGGRR
jgi:hypothetical protein